ncbi:hypothetical protein FRX94_05505 [Corynebacterium canis]|uniref:Uncharacterized protein n=1 Tax=Corynebacterium canis TaxID=679663 RepID=A0A5C5UJY2_9CORY|nr:hypothetical protein [Corynebacterium canis]TWT26514.1 hypothetical protein FRX94_05505 [Corynebacterium canis]
MTQATARRTVAVIDTEGATLPQDTVAPLKIANGFEQRTLRTLRTVPLPQGAYMDELMGLAADSMKTHRSSEAW